MHTYTHARRHQRDLESESDARGQHELKISNTVSQQGIAQLELTFPCLPHIGFRVSAVALHHSGSVQCELRFPRLPLQVMHVRVRC